jgi:hypothetical protein
VKPLRLASWLGTGALVVLAGRAIAYALSPSPLALELSHQAGGSRLPLVTVVTLALAIALSSAVLWLAALGVRERHLLEDRTPLALPRLRLGLLVGRALALWLTTMLAFALLESYIHWRAGLGWHGLHCLTGPVHRDAIPLLGALSLVAAALTGAVEHVLAWMRRVLAELRSRPRLAARVPDTQRPAPELGLSTRLAGALGARGPPTLS